MPSIERAPSGVATAIIGPFGQRTELEINAGGYLTGVTSPTDDAVSMVYGAGGLLTSFTDARGETSTMTYDAAGRLEHDEDAAGGTHHLVRTGNGQSFSVARTTALGRTTTYGAQLLTDGSRITTTTSPDGTTHQASTRLDGQSVFSAPDGTTATQTESPETRFGLASPLVDRTTILPSGLTNTTTESRPYTGLNASTTYSYAVAAIDAGGNASALTTPIGVTTLAGQPSGPVMLAQDNFNRANGGLGPNWKVIDSNPRIVNQHVEELFAGDGWDSIPIYVGVTWPRDQYSQVSVQAATAHSGCSAIVRAKDDPVIEMYFVYVTGPLGPNARLTLGKFLQHNYTELWTSVQPVVAGDILYLSAVGSTLTVKLNGVVVTTQTDGSITAPGFAGLDITDYDGQGAPGDGQCDNWEGGATGSGPGALNLAAPLPLQLRDRITAVAIRSSSRLTTGPALPMRL